LLVKGIIKSGLLSSLRSYVVHFET